jgi:hypothetical protein
MSTPRGNGVSQRDLDRLADGELIPAERSSVLAKVAIEPDGWKRCALAFLENQSLRGACRSLVADGSPHAAPAAIVSRPPTTRPWRVLAGLSVAAAALLVAFFSGRSLGHRQGVAFASASAPSNEQRQTDDAQAPHDPKSTAIGKAADEQSHPGRPAHIVGLVKFEGAEGQQNSVPVVAAPGLDEKWLLSRPYAMSDYERHQWERRGWEIKEQRKVITVQLADGRQLSIPLDLVSLKPQPHGVF